jgi:hypothetical protein
MVDAQLVVDVRAGAPRQCGPSPRAAACTSNGLSSITSHPCAKVPTARMAQVGLRVRAPLGPARASSPQRAQGALHAEADSRRDERPCDRGRCVLPWRCAGGLQSSSKRGRAAPSRSGMSRLVAEQGTQSKQAVKHVQYSAVPEGVTTTGRIRCALPPMGPCAALW